MAENPTIGLISAVPFEAALVRSSLRGVKKIREGIVSGTIDGRHCIHAESGMGGTNAARAATILIETCAPSVILHFGIGGAYHGGGLGVGDIAVATEEVYADLGVITRDGFMNLSAMECPILTRGRKKFYNIFPMSRGLVRKALAIKEVHLVAGKFLTVTTATGTNKRADELIAIFGQPICENMEGAAVAHVCAGYGLPVLELRGISNMVEDRDIKGWKKERAAEVAQSAVLGLIRGF